MAPHQVGLRLLQSEQVCTLYRLVSRPIRAGMHTAHCTGSSNQSRYAHCTGSSNQSRYAHCTGSCLVQSANQSRYAQAPPIRAGMHTVQARVSSYQSRYRMHTVQARVSSNLSRYAHCTGSSSQSTYSLCGLPSEQVFTGFFRLDKGGSKTGGLLGYGIC